MQSSGKINLSYNSLRFEYITSLTIDAALNILVQKLQFTSRLSLHGKFNDNPEALEEIKKFFRHVVMDNTSMVAIDCNSWEIVGVIFIKLRVSKYCLISSL